MRTDHATQQTTFRRKDARRYVVADKNRKTYINDGSDGRERPRRRHKTGKDCLTDTREVRVYDYGGKFTNLFDIYIIMIFFGSVRAGGFAYAIRSAPQTSQYVLIYMFRVFATSDTIFTRFVTRTVCKRRLNALYYVCYHRRRKRPVTDRRMNYLRISPSIVKIKM